MTKRILLLSLFFIANISFAQNYTYTSTGQQPKAPRVSYPTRTATPASDFKKNVSVKSQTQQNVLTQQATNQMKAMIKTKPLAAGTGAQQPGQAGAQGQPATAEGQQPSAETPTQPQQQPQQPYFGGAGGSTSPAAPTQTQQQPAQANVYTGFPAGGQGGATGQQPQKQQSGGSWNINY